MNAHLTRKHSKYSASGSERRLNCLASPELEETSPPSEDSVWSLDGTKTHEVLEVLFNIFTMDTFKNLRGYINDVMLGIDPRIQRAMSMVKYVLKIKASLIEPDLQIEARIHNGEIDPDMFGTVDAYLAELFGMLHVFDYKDGQSAVAAQKNTQLLQYALGIAEKYDWNFQTVVLHICQPKTGPPRKWQLSIEELKKWRAVFRANIKSINEGGHKPTPGSWCHWCRAKNTCPAKQGIREEKTANRFTNLDEGKFAGAKTLIHEYKKSTLTKTATTVMKG